jgi:hypothetical protein
VIWTLQIYQIRTGTRFNYPLATTRLPTALLFFCAPWPRESHWLRWHTQHPDLISQRAARNTLRSRHALQAQSSPPRALLGVAARAPPKRWPLSLLGPISPPTSTATGPAETPTARGDPVQWRHQGSPRYVADDQSPSSGHGGTAQFHPDRGMSVAYHCQWTEDDASGDGHHAVRQVPLRATPSHARGIDWGFPHP